MPSVQGRSGGLSRLQGRFALTVRVAQEENNTDPTPLRADPHPGPPHTLLPTLNSAAFKRPLGRHGELTA